MERSFHCNKCGTPSRRCVAHGTVILCSPCSKCIMCKQCVTDTTSRSRDGILYNDNSVAHIECYKNVIGGLPLDYRSRVEDHIIFQTPDEIRKMNGKYTTCEVAVLTDNGSVADIRCTLTVADRDLGVRRWICKASVSYKEGTMTMHHKTSAQTIYCEQEGPSVSVEYMMRLLVGIHKKIPDVFEYFYGGLFRN